MRPLRQQVDRIDRKILRLLQQRNEVSRRIGETKRRHGAAIYVPERERALLDRLLNASEGALPRRAVQAIYREIFSASRAEQGQAPIGVLKASLAELLSPGRWRFGACDTFSAVKDWPALSTALRKGKLALGLLPGKELASILATLKGRRDFAAGFQIADEFAASLRAGKGLDDRVFVVVPAGHALPERADRLLILMECKSTVNAVKSLLRSMLAKPVQIDLQSLPSPSSGKDDVALGVIKLPAGHRLDGVALQRLAQVEGGVLVGAYLNSEIYGG